MAMDDILKLAFQNINQPNENFNAAFQQTGTMLDSQNQQRTQLQITNLNNQTSLQKEKMANDTSIKTTGMNNETSIADATMKTAAQIQVAQMKVAQQQKELQQHYASKASDLVAESGKPGITAAAKNVMIQSANEMQQRAGLPAMSQDFMKLYSSYPQLQDSYVQLNQAYQQSLADPSNKQASATMGKLLLKISSASASDVPSVLKEVDGMNKNWAAINAANFRANGLLNKAVELEDYKTAVTTGTKNAANQFTPGILNKPIPDYANGGKPMINPETGQPLLAGQAMRMLQKRAGSGSKPTDFDAQVLSNYSTYMGEQSAKQTQYSTDQKQMQDIKSSITGMSLIGAPKDVKAAVAALARNPLRSTDDIDDAMKVAPLVQSQMKTASDQEGQRRVYAQDTERARSSALSTIADSQATEQKAMPVLQSLDSYLRNPKATLEGYNALASDSQTKLAGVGDPAGVKGLMAQAPATTRISNFFSDITGGVHANAIDPTERQRLQSAIQTQMNVARVQSRGPLLNQLDAIQGAGGNVTPQLRDTMATLKSRISAGLAEPPIDKLQQMLARAKQSMSDPAAIKQDVGMHLLQIGYDPIKGRNYVDMQLKARQKGRK